MEYFSKWYRPFMVLATTCLLLITGLGWRHQAYTNNQLRGENYFLQQKVEVMSTQLDTITSKVKKMEETHPYLGKKWKSRKSGMCATGNFLGFLLYTPVDTSVKEELVNVLVTYKGPQAKINSLKRSHNHSSQHFHGKAVDLAWDEEVISFLISQEGKAWLTEHGITLYIEGRPGSKRVKKYTANPAASEYVFFNPSATGDHIHLNI